MIPLFQSSSYFQLGNQALYDVDQNAKAPAHVNFEITDSHSCHILNILPQHLPLYIHHNILPPPPFTHDAPPPPKKALSHPSYTTSNIYPPTLSPVPTHPFWPQCDLICGYAPWLTLMEVTGSFIVLLLLSAFLWNAHWWKLCSGFVHRVVK